MKIARANEMVKDFAGQYRQARGALFALLCGGGKLFTVCQLRFVICHRPRRHQFSAQCSLAMNIANEYWRISRQCQISNLN
jgi:hypothetical protein